jgi:hypothetical protein
MHASTSANINRSRLLPDVGSRSRSARRFHGICRVYEQVIGDVTDVERDLIRQAARLTLRAEQL